MAVDHLPVAGEDPTIGVEEGIEALERCLRVRQTALIAGSEPIASVANLLAFAQHAMHDLDRDELDAVEQHLAVPVPLSEAQEGVARVGGGAEDELVARPVGMRWEVAIDRVGARDGACAAACALQPKAHRVGLIRLQFEVRVAPPAHVVAVAFDAQHDTVGAGQYRGLTRQGARTGFEEHLAAGEGFTCPRLPVSGRRRLNLCYSPSEYHCPQHDANPDGRVS
jgi:hypothetical protein